MTQTYAQMAGLSPLAQGNRYGLTTCITLAGSIPARAGEPKLSASVHMGTRVYPRSRRETELRLGNVFVEQGLSPLAQGNLCALSLTQNKPGSQNTQFATVQFSDGTHREYDLVVGADGIHSSVRKLMFGNTEPRFCGQVGWRFIVNCPKGISGWTLFAGSQQVFLLIPVGHGLAYCYADITVPHAIEDPVEGRLERLRTRFKGFASPVQKALSQITSSEQIHFGAIEDILQEPWSTGNVLLIGDGAHATSPNMASGAAMAFEDALVLAREIATGASSAQVLSNYTDARIGRIRWLHEQTRARDKIRNLPAMVLTLMSRFLAKAVYRKNYLPFLTEI